MEVSPTAAAALLTVASSSRRPLSATSSPVISLAVEAIGRRRVGNFWNTGAPLATSRT